MKIFIQIILLALLYDVHFQVTAFVKTNDVRHYLGSRTPYRFKSNKNDTRIKYPGCKDAKIWMMIRHGTRLPNSKDILAVQNLTELKDEILLQHKNGKGQLSKEQLKEFRDWSIKLSVEKERFLALEGQDEMILLAERMHKRFPNVIKEKYNNKTFFFRHTATQRTHQSARYFTTGLFEKKDAQNVIIAPVLQIDKVLRFYKHCDRWQKQVKKNPVTYKEQRLYGISQEMNDTLATVSQKLGLTRVLTLGTVNLMYKMCGYETAWNKYHTSPWCYAFDEDTVKTLEYYHDLKAYWVDGYGYELTYRPACVSFKHMFKSFRKDQPRATFLFTHSGTILKLLTYLGLYKPESPLIGTTVVEDRQWRTTDIDTFAANLAFVLYKCKDGDRVLTLHQEYVVRLPMCDEDLCPLKTITNHFNESISSCSFNDMCNLSVDDVSTDASTSTNETIDVNTTQRA